MGLLIFVVALVVFISAFCSLTEAVLYSVSWSEIEKLRKKGDKRGELLYRLRSNVDEPITAILTLNTIANTAGAAIAGAAAVAVFGQSIVFGFSLVFTLLILLFSEILPKTIGVLFNRRLAPLLVRPLQFLVWTFWPFIACINFTVRFIGKNRMDPETSEEDVLALVSLSRKKGVLKRFEEISIQNILALDQKMIKEIMTPRTVVFSLPADKTVAEVWDGNHVWPYSRVPVYEHNDPEEIVGLVYRREILEALADDQDHLTLKDLMRPVHFFLETLTLDRVLIKFLESRIHLAVVVDEYGGIAGLVSLEDILEEILGKEIIDETDQVADMQELALKKGKKGQR